MKEAPKHSNALIHSQSPYLLQHAHNPVNWMEWGAEAWAKAKSENKPVLVSIGYSSCHWCHVMERETFENEDSAAIMNAWFVCIKVDREERPDIDRIYMDALQLMTNHGGWPLNMFCLPDGRPLYGGTYFQTRQWNQLLFQLHDLYSKQPADALDYAQKLTEALQGMDGPMTASGTLPDKKVLDECIAGWAKQFDWTHGGNARTPKFPLPSNFRFLLAASYHFPDSDALKMVEITLDKMAVGGIYDALQGGFARYSTDAFWKVPHFEKMLYDNGQLVSLYARGYCRFKKPLYRKRVEECITFMEEEWLNKDGLYYSSFDADSEGEEGTYYVWSYNDIPALHHNDFIEYYGILPEGNWEHGKNILHATLSEEDYAKLAGIDPAAFAAAMKKSRSRLLEARKNREKPGLDTKCILSWNALLLEGLCDASRFVSGEYLPKAIALAEAIEANFRQDEYYQRLAKGNIPAFLEDLAALCSAYISLYQVCFDEKWLRLAKAIAGDTKANFYDSVSGYFFFVSSHAEQLIVRKKELNDDVIPSANAQLAQCFIKLYYYFLEPDYREIAMRMLQGMGESFAKFAPWYAHWGESFLLAEFGVKQLCLTGEGSKTVLGASELRLNPALLLAAGEDSQLPILAQRGGRELRYFLCHSETCHNPVHTESEVEALLKA